MIINSNPTAKLTQRYLQHATSSHSDSMKKLASGSRINSAKDDAAGLQISNRLQAQRSGFDVAIRNASDATSMLQTAEGAMDEYTDNLMRMRDLTLQYANGVNSTEDHDAIREEFNALKDELKRITETASFGGQRLLNGTNSSRSFQIGSDAGEAIYVQFPDLESINEQHQQSTQEKITVCVQYADKDWRTKPGERIVYYTCDPYSTISVEFDTGLSIEEAADQINKEIGDKIHAYVDHSDTVRDRPGFSYYSVSDNRYFLETLETQMGCFESVGASKIFYIEPDKSSTYILPSLDKGCDTNTVIEQLDEILQYIDSERARLGAVQNRLSHAINNLSQSSENVAASNSQIRDTDFARETSKLAKESILKETNTAMLAQASKAPQEVLNLLK